MRRCGTSRTFASPPGHADARAGTGSRTRAFSASNPRLFGVEPAPFRRPHRPPVCWAGCCQPKGLGWRPRSEAPRRVSDRGWRPGALLAAQGPPSSPRRAATARLVRKPLGAPGRSREPPAARGCSRKLPEAVGDVVRRPAGSAQSSIGSSARSNSESSQIPTFCLFHGLTR